MALQTVVNHFGSKEGLVTTVIAEAISATGPAGAFAEQLCRRRWRSLGGSSSAGTR